MRSESVLKSLRLAAACLNLLSLCSPACSQVVIDVATAEELKIALANGNKHIRITDHIDGSNVQPSWSWDDGSKALFIIDSATASITGACTDKPSLDLVADWKPSMCLIHVPGISVGFAIIPPGPVLWMDSLYVYVTGDIPAEQTREGLYFDLDRTGSSIYLTNVSTELLPDHLPDKSETGLYAIGSAKAPRFEFLLAGCSTVINHVNVNASDADLSLDLSVFGGYDNSALPETATVNMIDSSWINIGAARDNFVWFETDMRVEDCTFSSDPELSTAELLFYGMTDSTTRWLYGEMSAGVSSYFTEDNGYEIGTLDLALSTAEERAAEGWSAFLTLEDSQLLALQAEVSGSPPVPEAPASAPLSGGPTPALGPIQPQTPLAAPAPAPVPDSAEPTTGAAAPGQSTIAETGLAVATSFGRATLAVLAAALAAVL